MNRKSIPLKERITDTYNKWDNDNDYDWDAGDDWDAGGMDWDSDW